MGFKIFDMGELLIFIYKVHLQTQCIVDKMEVCVTLY